MRRWTINLMLCLAAGLLATPAMLRADEPGDDDKKADRKSDSDNGKDESRKDGDSKDDKDGKDAKSGKDKKKSDPIKKLIEIRLDPYLVPARAINIALPGRVQTVRELMEKMDNWADDDDVGAVLFNMDGVSLSIPDVEELRTGLNELRESGKKVTCFLNSGDPMGYLLACAADEICLAPTGSMSIPGMGRVFPFMRGMYQMQGVEYDVITAGAYKYPGFVNQREPNKYFLEEFNQIMDGWFEDYVNIIASGRKMSEEKVRKAIDIALFDAQEAKNYGLVDMIAYYDEYVDRVVRRDKFQKTDADSGLTKITSLQDLMTSISRKMQEAQDKYKEVGPKIAVVHARGPIIDANLGSGLSSSIIMRDEFVKTLEEVRKNKTVRAVVLRVDSPGGSGYASDIIWRKLKELDEEKPVVVSMGSVAGSGGYYIACPGRLIFAEPTTITGSIGVLAILPNQASLLNRMDVNLMEMKRGERSLFGSGHRDMAPADREFLQKYMLDFYEIFLDRVAAGRKMPKDELRKIAGGRIYTGRQAQKIGLVDRLGGLKDAIAAVREMAGIPASAEIKLVHYPRPSSLGELAESMFGMQSMMEMATLAERPAASVSFDSQLRFFAQQPKALCWMAVPEPCAAFGNPSAALNVIELTDFLSPPALRLPEQPALRR